MESNLNEDILNVIEKNLSSHIGSRLKEVLAKGEKDAARVELLEKELEKCKISYSNECKKTRGHIDIDNRETSCAAREKELDKNEQALVVKVLEIKLNESEKRSDMIMDFTSKLVRNTSVRKNIFDSEDVGGYPIVDGSGTPHYPAPTNRNHTSSEEIE